MTDHISPEDLDVAAVLAEVSPSTPLDSDAVSEISLQGVLADIQNLAKSAAASPAESVGGEESLVSLAKSAAAAAASAAESLEKNEAQIARIEKSLASLAEAIQALLTPSSSAKPLIVKSITHVESSPLDTAPAPAVLTKSQVMDRAIAAMMATDDQSRLVELRSGIARLESNFHPATIAAELRLS